MIALVKLYYFDFKDAALLKAEQALAVRPGRTRAQLLGEAEREDAAAFPAIFVQQVVTHIK